MSACDIGELTRSIRSVGILQPLVVTAAEAGGYVIVCGERRWGAAIEAGLTTVPCVVRRFTDEERQEAMLIENLQRQTLRPLEEAHAYERLLCLGHTQARIAHRVGRSQGHISRRLALLHLSDNVQARIDRHEIPVNQALGYEAAKPRDVFAADEQLHHAWLALRQEVVDSRDRRLIRLLHEFADAYLNRMTFTKAPSRRGDQAARN